MLSNTLTRPRPRRAAAKYAAGSPPYSPQCTPRNRDGCLTCRVRRKRCSDRLDDGHSTEPCRACVRLGVECLGYSDRRPRWMDAVTVAKVREAIKGFLRPFAQPSRKGTLSLRRFYERDDTYTPPFPTDNIPYYLSDTDTESPSPPPFHLNMQSVFASTPQLVAFPSYTNWTPPPSIEPRMASSYLSHTFPEPSYASPPFYAMVNPLPFVQPGSGPGVDDSASDGSVRSSGNDTSGTNVGVCRCDECLAQSGLDRRVS